MDGREYLHRYFVRIIAHELLVDLDDAAELDVQFLRILVRQIEVHHVLAVNAELLVDADVENFTRRDVARHQVAVSRIFLFKEIPRLAVLVRPDAAALAACRFAHQPQLVLAGDGRRMDLDELAIRVVDALAGIPRLPPCRY